MICNLELGIVNFVLLPFLFLLPLVATVSCLLESLHLLSMMLIRGTAPQVVDQTSAMEPLGGIHAQSVCCLQQLSMAAWHFF